MANHTDNNQRSLLSRIAEKCMQDNGFLTDFPPEVTAQLANITEKQVSVSGPVRDLRNLLWCLIELNDDSEDLDQLSVAESTPKGVKIFVSIADVDSVAGKNSVFEDHAKHNTTSVYTVHRVFPMLPGETFHRYYLTEI